MTPHLIPRLGIGYVPQGRRIFPKLTVLENLKTPVRRGEDREKDPRRGLRVFSSPSGAGRPAGRYPKRRRAADAGHRSGPHHGPEADNT